MTEIHSLYRFYNATGQLLYVGITNNPPHRFKCHEKTKDWWDEVVGITLEKYQSREELERAEKRAISVEHPLHNIVHNGSSRQKQSQPLVCEDCGRAGHKALSPNCYMTVSVQIFECHRQLLNHSKLLVDVLLEVKNESTAKGESLDLSQRFAAGSIKAADRLNLVGDRDALVQLANDLVALDAYRDHLINEVQDAGVR